MKKNKKTIINILLLILIYFFSFHIFPKLSFYNKIDFVNIKTNIQNFNYLNYNRYDDIKDISFNSTKNIRDDRDIFLREYLNYLGENQYLITDKSCPKELLANNFRNIQVYNSKYLDPLKQNITFNVRFVFYKFFGNKEKSNINKCFKHIFIENINKFHFLYRQKQIKNLELRISLIKNIKKNIENLSNLQKINLYEFIIEEIKKQEFFIDPDISYKILQRNESSKTIIFVICILILLSINIMFNKLNSKQVSKFINQFLNT